MSLNNFNQEEDMQAGVFMKLLKALCFIVYCLFVPIAVLVTLVLRLSAGLPKNRGTL